MNFLVNGVEIYYTDRIFNKGLRCIPKDDNFAKIIRNGRNKYPAQLQTMFNLSEEEQKEYDDTAPKGENALADVIERDCKNHGLLLIKREEVK